MHKILRVGILGTLLCSIVLCAAPTPAYAAEASNGEFSVQVSPSPLAATLKPGETTKLELKVRNASPAQEQLKIVPRSFRVDNNSQQLEINDDQEPGIADWLTITPQTFTVASGQTATVQVTVAVPKDSGFSYSFAFVISRAKNENTQQSGRVLKARVAIFTLFNIDRPGAVRTLEVTAFKPSKSSYEYLPAELEVTFKNTGNTIAQPAGNIFIQRGKNDAVPLAVLGANEAASYILPGTSRTLKAQWADGFPVVKTATQPDGSTASQTEWNWGNLSHFRFGSYTAKLVAVYDNGYRDIPLTAEATFWVVPWKIILGLLVIIALLGLGVWFVVSKVIGLGKRATSKKRMRF